MANISQQSVRLAQLMLYKHSAAILDFYTLVRNMENGVVPHRVLTNKARGCSHAPCLWPWLQMAALT